MGLYDTIDLDWTWNGDYMVGPDGDLKDTSKDLLLSLENEIRTAIKADFGDWELHPTIGADLSDFRGKPNTRDTGELIRQRIVSKLVNFNIVKAEDLDVRIVPVHVNQVLGIIRVQATATPGNNLRVGEPVTISFLYDSSEHDVFFMPPNLKERDYFFRGPK